jgi:hypothetical protein
MLSRQFHVHSRGYTDHKKPWLRTPDPKLLNIRAPRLSSSYSPPKANVFMSPNKENTGHTAYAPRSNTPPKKPVKPYVLLPPFEKAEIARTLALTEKRLGTEAKVAKIAEFRALGYPAKSQYEWLATWLGVLTANEAAGLDPNHPDTPSPYNAFRWIGGVYTLDVQAQREAQHQVMLAAIQATPGTKDWIREKKKPKDQRNGPMKRSELTDMLNRLAQETTLRRTGVLPLGQKPMTENLKRRWIRRLDLHRRGPDWMTEARLEAASDIRSFYSQATMLYTALRHPGAPGENIHKKLACNMDALTCFIERGSSGEWVYAPKGYEGKITTSASSGLDGQFSVKTYLLLSTTGVVLTTLSVLGDKGLPEGEILKMQVPGWGKQAGDGHIWICKSTHPTKEFYDQVFTELVVPAMERLGLAMPPRPDGLPHAFLYMCDGEREQIQSLVSPGINALFLKHLIAVLKHHRSASSLWQFNDVARTHQIIHSAVKSGRYSKFLDGTVWQWVLLRFAAAVKEIKQRHPDYSPSKSVQDRLKAGVRVLQPILMAIDDAITRDGVQVAGFDITTDPNQLLLNDSALLGRLSGVASMTGPALREVWDNLGKLRAKAVLEKWCRVVELEMDILGIPERPKQARVRATPGRVQPDDHAPNRQRALLITLFDDAKFKTDIARKAEDKLAAKQLEKTKKAEEKQAKDDKKALEKAEKLAVTNAKKLKAAEDKVAKQVEKDAQKVAKEAVQQAKKDKAAEDKAIKTAAVQAKKDKAAEARAIKAAKKRARSRSPVSRSKRAKISAMGEKTDDQKWQAAVTASKNFSGLDQCADCHVWWEKLEEIFHPDIPCDWFSCSHCSLNWCGFCWTDDDDQQHSLRCSNT